VETGRHGDAGTGELQIAEEAEGARRVRLSTLTLGLIDALQGAMAEGEDL